MEINFIKTMNKTFKLTKNFFSNFLRFSLVQKTWFKFMGSALLFSGYQYYNLLQSSKASCNYFKNSRFNYSQAAKSTIVIYDAATDKPIATGMIIDPTGVCISIGHIFPKVSEDRLDLENFKARILGDNQVYELKYIQLLGDDDLVFQCHGQHSKYISNTLRRTSI
jgi:hypothetical protein